MKFYTEKAMPSSAVYIWLGSIYLRVGKFQDYIVGSTFEHNNYKDYHGVKITSWEGYAWTTKKDSNMIEIKKETVKKWNIHLHKELYRDVIILIFMHNPTPIEGE